MNINTNHKKVRIKMISPTSKKLGMVKIIKDYTGLGLKDSKDIVDTIHTYPNKSIEIPMSMSLTSDGVEATAKSLSNALIDGVDGEFLINGGVQFERNKKLLDLGIGTQEEYSDFIFDYIIERPLESKNKFSKLGKEKLEEIYKILVEGYDSNS